MKDDGGAMLLENGYDHRNNSDYKRFNVDDDVYQQENLRIGKTSKFLPIYSPSENKVEGNIDNGQDYFLKKY